MTRAAVVVALVACALPVHAQDPPGGGPPGSVVVVLPDATPGALLDALRIELRARGTGVSVVLVPGGAAAFPVEPDSTAAIVRLRLAENPLEPPEVRRTTARGELVRSARISAALDAIAPRVFALEVAALLDDDSVIAVPDDERSAASASGAILPATDDGVPPPRASSAEPSASIESQPAPERSPEASDPRDVASPPPPTIFHPVVGARLGGGMTVMSGGDVGGAVALELSALLSPWLVFLGEVLVSAGDSVVALWGGFGVGLQLEAAPGSLLIAAEAGLGMDFGNAGGFGGGAMARWEIAVGPLLRIGPKVAFHAWDQGMLARDPQERDVAWQLFVGADLFGFDLSLGG